MSTWIEIKIGDLYAYLAAMQVDAINKCAAQKNQTEPITEIIHDISLKIRAQIASNKRNSLSERQYAIPPELKSEACNLILETAQTRIPGLKLTSDQVRLADQARLHLQKIVKGDIIVSVPGDMETRPQKTVEVVNSRRSLANAKTLKGF